MMRKWNDWAKLLKITKIREDYNDKMDIEYDNQETLKTRNRKKWGKLEIFRCWEKLENIKTIKSRWESCERYGKLGRSSKSER